MTFVSVIIPAHEMNSIFGQFHSHLNNTPSTLFKGFNFHPTIDLKEEKDIHAFLKRKSRQMNPLLKKLEDLKNLKPGWDSYDAAPPNEVALKNARTLLEAFLAVGIPIAEVAASAEGGVAIVFSREPYQEV